MSYWYEPKKEDISIEYGDIDIYLGFNDDGNIYATLKLEEIKKVIREFEEKELENQP